jgi:hypothetical protein
MTDGTIAGWIASREPAPPEALTARMIEALGADAALPESRSYDACLAAGERLLAALLDADATGRAAALDLLAVDALVSCAFEAAGNGPEAVEARAGDALARLSLLGAR